MMPLAPIDLMSSPTQHDVHQQAEQLRSTLRPDLRRQFSDMPLLAPSAFARAFLSLNLSLKGETYTIRYQAKGRGYTWRTGAWHRQLSTPLFNLDTAALTQGLEQLNTLIAAEQEAFGRECNLDRVLVTLPTGVP
ncbi:hypothetical protein [Deinococcus sp. Leaf326]|uniref:hypothetical protein n=1 Tax=Deinococcus sp. Leaf326 TaxID=1736338 RepID=UPI000701C185|nr:hypothetical protein [Deinococcus sp. Leaf326]KQR18790.1 hypothetical protein ASF71_19860 [Deinococcus sp. Leaf326]